MKTLPRASQSPTDPAFVQDPYPFYDNVRRLGPLVWWEDYALPVAAGFAEVNSLLRDRRLGREAPADLAPAIPAHLAPFYDIEAHSMLELEPPRHTRLRSLVLRAFTSRQIARLSPRIEDLCHDLIDRFPDGPVDLLPAYCTQVPVVVIARLLGVPEDMAPQLLRWSNAMVSMYQARRDRAVENAAVSAASDFAGFMCDYVKDRRSRPADDLITHLIAAEVDGDRLTTDELITTCILLLNAGHEATVHTMGNGIKSFLETGHDTDSLAPEAVEATVEEMLRHDPPLHMFTRYVYQDTELFGAEFRRGDRVACLLGAANRDPAVFPNPERFQPSRPVRPNASFGAGIHFCVGAPLARLELQVALPILFARLPHLRLVEQPRYANLYHFRGLERLVVTAD